MTTIAYRDGILAGDTRVTTEDLVSPEKIRKVFKLRNGCLFAHCGDAEEGELLKRSIMRSGPMPKLKDSDAICIMPDGAVLFTEGLTWSKIDAPFIALGSGKQFAYGAMQVGASAADAVRAACKLDKHSGLPIQTVRLTK
jgi:20S proteasome alpha/beta subunit